MPYSERVGTPVAEEDGDPPAFAENDIDAMRAQAMFEDEQEHKLMYPISEEALLPKWHVENSTSIADRSMPAIDSLKLYKLVNTIPSAVVFVTSCGSVWTHLLIDHVKDLEVGTAICVSTVHEDHPEGVAINWERTQEGWIITAIN